MSDCRIQAILAFEDNYIWLIENQMTTIIIDPGSSQEVLAYLQKNQLTPSAILVTHHHDDHTGGVRDLLSQYKNCALYAHANHGFDDIPKVNLVDEGDHFVVGDICFQVWRTAGHTDSHLSYVTDIDQKTRVFCGDTLFSAGCGRVFTGTISQLFASMKRFNDMDEQTMFYPAHEYTVSNLKFAKSVALDEHQDVIKHATNIAITQRQNNQMTLPVSLAHERQINVFLHACDDSKAKKLANQHGLNDNSALAVFRWLREQKNHF